MGRKKGISNLTPAQRGKLVEAFESSKMTAHAFAEIHGISQGYLSQM